MSLKQLQPKLFKQFQQIIQSDQISHAYLFSGGFGNLDMAIYLAQSRFCQDKIDKLPCQRCRSCRLIASEDFSDVKIIRPVNQVIKTDTIRQLLQEFSKSGYESSSQFFIIQDADKMHLNASNSLLKLMEEPIAQSYLVLLTDDENKILPTIRSRCQEFHFLKNRSLLVGELENKGFLKTEAEILAELVSNWEDVELLSSNHKILELIKVCQRWVNLLSLDDLQAYLEVSRLVTLASDKGEQELVFKILPILFNQSRSTASLNYLSRLVEAYRMWQHHVNFQNVLEYMVLV